MQFSVQILQVCVSGGVIFFPVKSRRPNSTWWFLHPEEIWSPLRAEYTHKHTHRVTLDYFECTDLWQCMFLRFSGPHFGFRRRRWSTNVGSKFKILSVLSHLAQASQQISTENVALKGVSYINGPAGALMLNISPLPADTGRGNTSDVTVNKPSVDANMQSDRICVFKCEGIFLHFHTRLHECWHACEHRIALSFF